MFPLVEKSNLHLYKKQTRVFEIIQKKKKLESLRKKRKEKIGLENLKFLKASPEPFPQTG